jgi:hypothetical protein
MLDLRVGGFEVPFVAPPLFASIGASHDSASAAVVAHAVHGYVVDHSLVIDVNIGDVYVVDAAVVEKVSSVPIAASVAGAEISEAVVNAAVEANVRTPVTGVPKVES